VWRAFGNPPNYVEPFAGSLAVLLGRPDEAKIETVNDVDCCLSNFWRAVTLAPDDVAEWCDYPVLEACLHARHRWLVEQLTKTDFRERMRHEPDFFDAKIAGWWAWGLSMWIGSGWCQVDREGSTSRSARGVVHEKRPELYGRNGGRGVHRPSLKRPNAKNGGQGVHARELNQKPPRLTSNITGRARHRGSVAWNARPDLDGNGQGVHSTEGRIVGQLPCLQGGGKGIAAPSRLPSLGNARGVLGTGEGRWAEGAPRSPEGPPCLEWFRALQARLRRVRVCCGDWKRVLTDSVIGTTSSRNSGMNPCAIFLDPPYPDDERARDLYGVDDGSIWHEVARWAIEHGDDPDLRIAICGYEGGAVFPSTWTEVKWKATRGYAAEDNPNRGRERIWLSPNCLPLEDVQTSFFPKEASR
jgi:hypothetical protein